LAGDLLGPSDNAARQPAQRARHDVLHRLKEHITFGWPTVLFKSGALIGRDGKGLLFHSHTIYPLTALSFFSVA
jgi:hypothetical protein